MKTDKAEIVVVVNPVGTEDQARALSDALAEQGVRADWVETTEDDPGVGQSRDAAAAGAATVIACGGDGTVRACVEGLAGSETALGVVPAGTGNLLARNFDIPEDPSQALEIALSGTIAVIDVGYANDEAFAIMAGAGLDAAIMRDTSREAKDLMGSLAYIWTGLSHLNDPTFHATLVVDGTTSFRDQAATVLAANLGRLQGGVDLFPDSEPNDGRLEFMTVAASSLSGWLRSSWAILTNKQADSRVHRFSGTTAQLSLSRPTPYQLDGDERDPTTSITFETRPGALRLRVPGGSR